MSRSWTSKKIAISISSDKSSVEPKAIYSVFLIVPNVLYFLYLGREIVP